MSAENDIRKASDNFYPAFNTTLNRNWTTHGGCMVTQSRHLHNAPRCWDRIRVGSDPRFVGIFSQNCSNGRVELRDQRISVNDGLPCKTGADHVNVLIAKEQGLAKSPGIQRFRSPKQRVESGSPPPL